MTTFTAQMRAWTDKVQRNMDLIVKDAAQEVFARATTRQAGVSDTGGSFEVGKVPVDTGFLVGTAELRIGDAITATGTVSGASSAPPDFEAGLTGMTMGEPVTMVYTAPYARPVEYGHGSVAGRLFVTSAVQDWQSIVDGSVAKFRDA